MRGTVQAIAEGGKELRKDFAPEILRVTPTYLVSLRIHDDVVQPAQGGVNYHGHKVEETRKGLQGCMVISASE